LQSEVPVGSDEIDKGLQAREDVLNALIQSNAIPNVDHLAVEGMEEIKALWRRAAETTDIFVFQIEREVVEKGAPFAAGTAWILTNMPPSAHGRVMLAFQGWAEDPRELFEIPVVVDYCRVLLLGSLDKPSLKHAQALLRVLVDEMKIAESVGARGHDIAGQHWLTAVAFHEEIMSRSLKSATGIFRNVNKALKIRRWLLGQGPAPTA
jgi:hypothetical protein